MEKSSENSRRSFIRTAATGALAVAVAPSALADENFIAPEIIQAKAKGANDRIRVAVLGINGRGKNHIEEIMGLSEKANVEVAVLCDPDMTILQEAANNLRKKYGGKVLIEQDFRKNLRG